MSKRSPPWFWEHGRTQAPRVAVAGPGVRGLCEPGVRALGLAVAFREAHRRSGLEPPALHARRKEFKPFFCLALPDSSSLPPPSPSPSWPAWRRPPPECPQQSVRRKKTGLRLPAAYRRLPSSSKLKYSQLVDYMRCRNRKEPD